MTYTLYGDYGTAAFAPHAVLDAAGIDYAFVHVDRNTSDIRSETFLALSPGGYVPALVTPEGEAIYETAATCLYLGARHKLKDIYLDADDPDLGVFLRGLFYLTNTVQEACKLFYYPHRYAPETSTETDIRDNARDLLFSRWRVVDDHLEVNGPYHLGQRYSLVDLYMTMLADWYPERDEMLERYPSVGACFERVTRQPELAATLRAHEIIA